MTIQVVDQERLRELCERYGIASLEVFGSVARGMLALIATLISCFL